MDETCLRRLSLAAMLAGEEDWGAVKTFCEAVVLQKLS